jgi:hypothetical protein
VNIFAAVLEGPEKMSSVFRAKADALRVPVCEIPVTVLMVFGTGTSTCVSPVAATRGLLVRVGLNVYLIRTSLGLVYGVPFVFCVGAVQENVTIESPGKLHTNVSR